MNRFLRNLFFKGRIALFVTVASIGFILVINGALSFLPSILSGITSIIIGLGILFVMGWFGYGILSKN